MASQAHISRPENDFSILKNENEIYEKVDTVQESIDTLNKEASSEILKVEQKYNNLRAPHYKERSALLAKIPGFWLAVFMNNLRIRRLVTEEDENVLACLHTLEVQEFDDITSGYKIIFHFEKNDYFNNEILTKEYRIGENGEPTTNCTKIDWKPSKNLTENRDNRKDGQKRTYPLQPSFFSWFSDKCDSFDNVIGESIKDEIWPNPLQFYLDPDMDTDVDDEDDEEDEEDDDEDDTELNCNGATENDRHAK